MNKFDTHKFLYTLFHEGRISGHRIVYVDKENVEQSIRIEGIEIGPSPITCRVTDEHGKKHKIMFVRVREVWFGDDRVWENTDLNLSDVKIIKGYK